MQCYRRGRGGFEMHCSLHLALAALMQAGTLGLAAREPLYTEWTRRS